MNDEAFNYRIKKLIQRADPIEFIQLIDGQYYWLCDGTPKQLDALITLSRQRDLTPRLTTIIDKGVACLHQVERYLTWLNGDGLSDFMHCGITPFPPIPDWLIWHENKRLHSCKGDGEISVYFKQMISYLGRMAKCYPSHPDGWLIHSNPTTDYVINLNGKSLACERSCDVVKRVFFGHYHDGIITGRGSQDEISGRGREDEAPIYWATDANR